jgi:poly-gamma-glutamate synthesis protein (capsule biosynthesis protein)
MLKLNWKQRMQRYIKRQKKQTDLHTFIAIVFFLVTIPIASFISSPSETVKVTKDPNSQLTITMVGDMMFGRNIKDYIASRKGYDYSFEHVLPYFRASDYVTGNFENPITSKEEDEYKKADKFIHISTEKEAATALKKAGFHSVTLANNHMLDYGPDALSETIEAFAKAGVDTVGAGRDYTDARRVSYKEVNGIRIAIVGLSEVMPKEFAAKKNRAGIASMKNVKSLVPLIVKAKRGADLVIVHAHWGAEYDSGAHPVQEQLGRIMIDAGADIVIGHHPHVLEPVEIYNGGVIFYSLGNFVFDQGWSRTRESVLAQYKINFTQCISAMDNLVQCLDC